MKIIYIAGPFRGPTSWAIEKNVREAEALGFEVAKLGCMPLIPHNNTRFFQGELTDEFWLQGTLELLRRCDGIILTDRWRESPGACREVLAAHTQRPIFGPGVYGLQNLKRWLEDPTVSFLGLLGDDLANQARYTLDEKRLSALDSVG